MPGIRGLVCVMPVVTRTYHPGFQGDSLIIREQTSGESSMAPIRQHLQQLYKGLLKQKRRPDSTAPTSFSSRTPSQGDSSGR